MVAMHEKYHNSLLFEFTADCEVDVLVVFIDPAVFVGDAGDVDLVGGGEDGEGLVGVGELGGFEVVDQDEGSVQAEDVEHLG